MTLTTYRCGVMTLSQTGEILMLMVGAGYLGTSTYGIKIGGQASSATGRWSPSWCFS